MSCLVLSIFYSVVVNFHLCYDGDVRAGIIIGCCCEVICCQ